MTPDETSSITPRDVLDFLRSNSMGTLRFDELVEDRKYVLDREGQFVFPVTHAMMDAAETVLFVPEERDDSLEALITLDSIENECEEADRWRIYHGQPREPLFARGYLDAAKYHGEVFDGAALTAPNPLASIEAAICRELNRDRQDDLRRLTKRLSGIDVPEPRLVGVRPTGLDVRASIAIVHVEFPRRATSEDDLRRLIDEFSGDDRGDGDPSE